MGKLMINVFNAKYVPSVLVGVFCGFLIAVHLDPRILTRLNIDPRGINPVIYSMEAKLKLACGGVVSRGVYLTPEGAPSNCFQKLVNDTSGYGVSIVLVDMFWKTAKEQYGDDQIVESQWKELAKISVTNFDEVEWPAVKFANVPVLSKVYSTPELLQLVDRFRTMCPTHPPQPDGCSLV